MRTARRRWGGTLPCDMPLIDHCCACARGVRRAAFATALLFALPPAHAAGTACELAPFEIAVTMKELRPIAQLRINGTPVPFLVDSGAFYSMLSPAAAAELNLRMRPARLEAQGLTGAIALRQTTVERLGLDNAEFTGIEFLVGAREPPAGTRGILGLNVLGFNDTEYDIANGAVRLFKPADGCKGMNLAYWAGSGPVVDVPLDQRRSDKLPHIRAKASINGKPVTVLFDTGAFSVLSLAAARQIGLVDDVAKLPSAGMVSGADGGVTRSWTVPIDTFQLGAERVTGGRLRVADFAVDDVDMLLGIDFFLSHRIYVARSQLRMYLTYAGGPIFDLSMQAATPAGSVESGDTPQDAAGFAGRGTAFAARGLPARAIEDLDRAIELAPTVAAYRVQRARVRLQQKQREAAITDLEDALRLDPGDPEARVDLDELRVMTEGAHAAIRADLLDLEARLSPLSPLRRRLGNLWLRLDEPAAAVRQFDLWLRAFPDEHDVRDTLNRRCWARALGNFELDRAMEDCERIVREAPNWSDGLDSRGMVRLRRGDDAGAIADYDAALQINPKSAWSHWGRGLAKIASGARDAGLADIAAAKELDPKIARKAERFGLAVPAEAAAAVAPR